MPNQYKNNKRTFTEPQRRAREIMGEGENDHKWGDDSYPDVLMYMTVAVIHHFMYTLMHTCLHVFFKVQVQQNDLTNIQRVKQTTQRARLVNLSHVAERRAMRCNEVWLQSKTVRLHKWVYGHKTSCHRESELVHHRLGQRAKSEPLARCINTHPTPPISTHGTTNRREHRRKKTSLATEETDQTALHNLRNGMFFFYTDTALPPAMDFGATFYRCSEMRRRQVEAQISLFPHFCSTLCRVKLELKKGVRATVHNSLSQAPRINTSENRHHTIGNASRRKEHCTFVYTWWRETCACVSCLLHLIPQALS